MRKKPSPGRRRDRWMNPEVRKGLDVLPQEKVQDDLAASVCVTGAEVVREPMQSRRVMTGVRHQPWGKRWWQFVVTKKWWQFFCCWHRLLSSTDAILWVTLWSFIFQERRTVIIQLKNCWNIKLYSKCVITMVTNSPCPLTDHRSYFLYCRFLPLNEVVAGIQLGVVKTRKKEPYQIWSSVTQTTSPRDRSKPSLVFVHKSDETKEDAAMTQGCLFL